MVNEGALTLTDVHLTATIDGVAQPVYEWTGNLSTGQSATVTLPAVNVGTGDHTVAITAALPNAITDENTANNTASESFSVLAGGGSTITVNTTTDNYGYETNWTLVNSSGAVILTGGSYDNNTSYTVDATCVADDCYTFTITDDYGDGICCSQGNGFYEILVDGVVSTSGGEFTTTETFDFCIDNTTTIPGCTDPAACNYDVTATDDDGSCTFPGCMDPAALNYNPDAGCDDGSCDDGGDTCNGADYCGEGTSWDASTEKCVVTYPADSDFDGCVTVSDILLALGSFGSCL